VPFIAAQAIATAGDWRLVPLPINGQLGCAAYARAADGDHHPYAIVVVATTTTHLTRISLFDDVTLFGRFGLPPTAPGSSQPPWQATLVHGVPSLPSPDATDDRAAG